MDFHDEFRGKRVVLTGAYGVFGAWIAVAFATCGAALCLSGSKPDRLEALAASLPLAEPPLLVPADLTREEDILALAGRVKEAWGAPDILVNNAGVYPSGFLLDTPTREWDRILGVNLRAPFILTREIATLMVRAKKKGAIINIGSGAANRMRASAVPYCLSKAALDRLTKGYALELAEYGIRVNLIEPGFASGSVSNPLPEEHVRGMGGRIPLGRESGPGDTPNAVLYLASEAASFITGATLAVDGGNGAGLRAVYQDKKHAL